MRAPSRSSWFALLATLALARVTAGCGAAPVSPAEVAPAEVAPAEADPAALEARRLAIRDQVKALIGDLTAEGRYDCCVEAPCNLCAMRAGGCRCGEGLRRGEPVCEECAMMWRRGNGAEPGVEAGTVRSYLEAEQEMEARAKASVEAEVQAAVPAKSAAAEAPGCACAEHAPK